MRKILIFAALTASGAMAGLVVTEQSATYDLRDAESKVLSRGYKTLAECWAAAPGPGRYRCLETHVADIVGVCDDVPTPAPVVINGFTERGDYEGHVCPDGVSYSFTQTQPVREPYPSCAWVDKPVPVTDCVGLIHPVIDDPDATAQISEPGVWIEGTDYALGAACPPAANNKCYPYPNKPKDPPPGCVSEYCVPEPAS